MRCVVASSPVSSAHVPRFLPEVSSGGSKSINSIRSSFGCLLLLCIVRIPTSVAAAPIAADDGLTAEQTEFFESKIRPVLADIVMNAIRGRQQFRKAGFDWIFVRQLLRAAILVSPSLPVNLLTVRCCRRCDMRASKCRQRANSRIL